MNDSDIEEFVADRPSIAPRVTMRDLENNIKHIEIVTHASMGGSILRWAVLTTRNGFAVTGKPSAAVSRANDNAELGEKIAIDNARHELWALMGYALKEQLSAMEEDHHV